MDGMKVTERFHVYPEPSEPHNEREPELIANENKANPFRWINPYGHEAWAGSGPEAIGLREAYEVVFGDSIERYNKKQKRKDRRKTVEGYMQEVREDGRGRKNKAIADANKRAEAQGRLQNVRKDQGKHEAYEVVLSLGNVKNRMSEEDAKKIFQRYAEDWPKRNPNFFLYRVDYHDGEYFRVKDDDEDGKDIAGIGGPPGKWSKGVPHPHLSFIPWADGFKKGMYRQNSVGKALEAMGLDSWQAWQEREREYIAQLAAEYGYVVVRAPEADRHDTSFSPDEYQELADAWTEFNEQKATLDGRQADLDQRDQVVQLREQSIQGMMDFLNDEQKQQEAELKKRQAELDRRAGELKEQQAALDGRKAELDQRDAELGRRERVITSGEANLKKEVARFKGQRERVKAWMNDTYVQRMGEVGTLARRMRRLTSDRSVASELAQIEQTALSPAPMFTGKQDDGPDR